MSTDNRNSCFLVYPAAAGPRKRSRREAAPFPVKPFLSNKTSAVFLSTATENIFPPRRPERKQRFCLNRLRDALEVVCSTGSIDRIPTYFNPSEYAAPVPAAGPNLNSTSSAIPSSRAGRGSRKLKNEIPTMAQSQSKRRVLRRRSRRNIVRECCERPCTYSDLSKYCSPSVRASITLSDPNIQPDNSLSSSPAKSSASHQQCVSVSDLQNYYLKFFHKQWKKSGYSNQKGQIIQEPDSEEEPSHVNNHNDDEDELIFPDAFFKNLRKQSNQAANTSPTSATKEESRIVNEIGENAVPQRKRVDQSGNLMTAPPINFVINIPRGTNDYIY